MDIIIIALLCLVNARTAKVRGRKPGQFIVLTIALTFGLSLIFNGFVLVRKLPDIVGTTALTQSELIDLVVSQLTTPLMIGTYSALAIGGIISFLVTRNCKRGDEFPPQQNPNGNPYGPQNMQNPNGNPYGPQNMQNPYGPQNMQNPYGNPYGQQGVPGGYGVNPSAFQNGQIYGPGNTAQPVFVQASPEMEQSLGRLTVPCTVCIIREPSNNRASDIYTFSLNGHPICKIANGGTASVMVNTESNTITARDGAGMSLKKPIRFTAVSGGYVEIHAKGDQFLHEKTVGKRPLESSSIQEEAEEPKPAEETEYRE